MLLTCLKCGNQTACAHAAESSSFKCVCGITHSTPIVFDAGVQPNFRMAEKTRTRAFRAAGVVKNVGGTALMVSALGLLFPLFGFIGAAMGLYQLIGLKGAKGRYSGRQSALIAVIGGLLVGTLVSHMWYSKWHERHERELLSLQEGAKSDLRNLLRAQRLHHATEERYGNFEECAYVAKDGFYTIYLGANEINPGNIRTTELPQDLLNPPFVQTDKFRAIAVGNLDDDPQLDIWEVTEVGQVISLNNDLE